MDKISEIAMFIRVLDSGSISAGARSLGISPAVASKRIISLEKHLGVRLLHRTTRQITPTPEGRELATVGRPLVEDLEALTTGLSQSAQQVVGVLRVTAPVTFGRHCLSPLLPDFLKASPKLKIQLDLSDESRDLVSDGFDLAIRIAGQLEDSSLVARRLANSRRVLCAAPAYIAEHGEPATPSELSAHACLVHAFISGSESHWRLRNREGHTINVPVGGQMESNLGDALKDAAIGGLGISLHTVWHVCDDIKAGRLVQLLPDYYTESAIYAVMPNRRLVPPRVRAFVDYLTLRLNDEYWAHESAQQ